MGINTPKKNRVDQTSSDQALIDGLNKHEAAIPAVVIAGVTVATKALVTTVQSRIDSSKAVLSKRAAWQAAIQDDRALRDKTKTFVAGLKQALLVSRWITIGRARPYPRGRAGSFRTTCRSRAFISFVRRSLPSKRWRLFFYSGAARASCVFSRSTSRSSSA